MDLDDPRTKVIFEIRRMFAAGEVFSRAENEEFSEFERFIYDAEALKDIVRYAARSTALNAAIISNANRFFILSGQQKADSLEDAILRIGKEGCLVALNRYKYESMRSRVSRDWAPVYEQALTMIGDVFDETQRITKSRGDGLRIEAASLAVISGVALFAKIMAAANIGLRARKNDAVMEFIFQPDTRILRVALVGTRLSPAMIERIVNTAESESDYTAYAAQKAWTRVVSQERE